MRPLFPALFAVAVLSVSGCFIDGTQTASSPGVVVESFGPLFPVVQSGEPVTFRLLARNTGSSDATDAHAELLGLDQAWCENSGCRASAAGFAERLPEEEECQYTGQGFTLRAPDTALGSPGGAQECTWRYSAPTLDRDLRVTYDATARVFYTYQSSTVKSLIISSVDELRRLQDSGQALPSQTVSKTSSPIDITIETQSPVRSWEDSATFPVKITVQNTGAGMACAEDSGSMKDACKKTGSGQEGQNMVLLTIAGNKLELSDDCDEFGNGALLSLARGVSNSFLCDVTATNLQDGLAGRTLTATARYEYAVDAKTSVTVTGLGYGA